MQSWDNEMWLSVVSDVWIPTQALEEMQIHRCPMGPGCCTKILTSLCWMIVASPLDLSLVPMTRMLPPHRSHLLLQLSQPHHSIHRHGCAIPGGSRLFNSQHGKSSSSNGKTEGWMLAKLRASSRPLYDVKVTPNTPQCPLTTCRMPTSDHQVQNELWPLHVSPSSYMFWRMLSPHLS